MAPTPRRRKSDAAASTASPDTARSAHVQPSSDSELIGHADSRNETEPSSRPAEHDIARRAYELFEQRGAEHGRDMDDWLQAERELNRGQ